MNKKAVLEGLLFVVGEEGMTANELQKVLEVSDYEFQKLIRELDDDYSSQDRGIQIAFLGNCYKLVTKQEHKEFYQKLVTIEENSNLSEATLETLAIIAYNEPITRVQVDEIRGVSSVHHVRKLLLKNLIREVGKSELPGRPILYGVTKEFLDYFGLSTIDDLPKISIEPAKEVDEMNLFESKYKEMWFFKKIFKKDVQNALSMV